MQYHFVWFNSGWYFPGNSILRHLGAGGGRERAERRLLTILMKRDIRRMLAVEMYLLKLSEQRDGAQTTGVLQCSSCFNRHS